MALTRATLLKYYNFHQKFQTIKYHYCHSTGLGGGAIAGIVIGVLIVAGLVTLVAVIGLCYIQAHNKRAKYG